ncbi:MAG: GIY-YIG nuclease family protein [Woeseiaceae bacterium]|nr:GIY-YIG nuclease family protein [Woeseiaceae bacterium]
MVATAGNAWHVYLIRCASGDLYTGITLDVTRRLEQHAGGRGSRFLRGKGPLELAWSEPVGDRGLAGRIEYRLRRLARTDKQALAAGRITLAEIFPDLVDPQASGAAGA